MKIVEGEIIKSDLQETEGFTYGTITIRNDEIQFDIRITRETLGEIPPKGSTVRVEYEGDVFFRALTVHMISFPDLEKVEPPKIPMDQFHWPASCASCGSEENLTRYDYVHRSTETTGFTPTGYSMRRQTTTHSLNVTGYLCPVCKTRTEKKVNRPAYISFVLAMAGITLGFIFPFIPGLVEFTPMIQSWNIYSPSVVGIILYTVVAGIPSLLCWIYYDRREYPFLEYIGIYASFLTTRRYKIILKSPKYKERFLRFNDPDSVGDTAGFRRFTFDYENLCVGVCCFGCILPIIAALLFHIIMG
ncbi:MAG: hypothetical protein ACFFF9_04960 [Candidatus Thorarchaeota archaeon]